MATEQVILDGLPLNDQVTWSIRADSFNFTPARKKFNWVSSALGDGAAQVGEEDHFENAEMVLTVRAKPQVDADTGLSIFHALTQKLQKARVTQGGIPLVWAPADSAEALTYYVQDAEYDELHTTKEGGWFDQSPEMVVHLYLRPFGHGSEAVLPLGYSDPFQFDSIGGGQWRWDTANTALATGSGSLTITGTSTTEKRIYLPWTTEDASVQMRVFVGTLGTAGAQVIARRSDSSNFLRAGLGTAAIAIAKTDGGTTTTLASENYTYAADTFYRILASFVGDDINLALYADGDTTLSTPLISTQYTLTGAEQVEFGEDARGNLGLRFVAPDTTWYIDQYTVEGMEDVKSSEPIVSVEIPDVPGHVKAEARMVVTEGSAKARRHFEMGWESRDYDLDYAPPVLLDSDVLSTGGFAGAQTTLGGGDTYDPHAAGTDIVYATSLSSVAAVTICSTGARKHVGAYKVKARVFGSGGLYARLAYRVGSGQKYRNPWVPLEGAFQEMDLGTIVVPQAEIGVQSWQGWIEAYGVNGGVFGVDYLMLIPVESYGVAKAPLEPIVADVFAARDSFDGAAGNLDGDVLPLGGSWVTSGDTPQAPPTGDFVVDATNDWATRTQVSDTATNLGRYARAGTTDYTSVQVRIDTYATGYAGPTVPPAASFRSGVLARYVDTNNWLMAVREPFVGSAGLSASRLRVYKRVAGTVTQLASFDHPSTYRPEANMTLILSVDATGVWQVFCFPAGTKQPSTPLKSGEDTVLATGGALATGRIGLYDAYNNANALTRIYNNFSAFTSVPDAILHPSRRLEIRSERAEREDAGGGDYGRLAYEGKRFHISPSGDGDKVTRLVTKLRRNNVDEGLPDTNVGDDAHTIQVFGTPRYLHPVGGG